MDKNTLRQQMIEKRQSMVEDDVRSLSKTVQERLMKSSLWPKSGRVGLYSPVKNEVMTQTLFQISLEQGLHVYYPRVEQGILFYEVNGPEDLQRGSWSILEPQRHCHGLEKGKNLDLLIVPGIVFTKDFYRIGYGKGFYDEFMGNNTDQIPTIGLAYEYQMVDSIQNDDWDQRLSAVITDRNIYQR